MRFLFKLLYLTFLYLPAVGQDNKGTLSFHIESGYRANQTNHHTPQVSSLGIGSWGANDRTHFASVWNAQGRVCYELPNIPFKIGLQAGIQWNQNVNFPGWTNIKKDFKPLRRGWRAVNMGIGAEYFFLKKDKHRFGALLGVNILYIPLRNGQQMDFSTAKMPPFGEIVSKNENDTIYYSYLINSTVGGYGFAFQLETGFVYEYAFAKNWCINARLYYQIGFNQMLSTSAYFGVTDPNDPNYWSYNNPSFSTNKGDAFCFNVGIGYKVPFYKKG